MRVVVATWNVHSCVGRDGRVDADRVGRVIASWNADVVALQEVDAGYWHPNGVDQLRHLAQVTSSHGVPGPTLVKQTGHYGNGLLSRSKVVEARGFELGVPGHEKRGAIVADVDVGGALLRVVGTHFGLRWRERRAQLLRLLPVFEEAGDRPVVLLGDLNEWCTASRLVRELDARLGASRARRTWPSHRPMFALDRIWVRGARVVDVRVDRTPDASVASDHLPLIAELELPG